MTTQDFPPSDATDSINRGSQESDLLLLYQILKYGGVSIDFQAIAREYGITDQEARERFAEIEARVQLIKAREAMLEYPGY